MNRRHFLKSAGLATIPFLIGTRCGKTPENQPNVVLVMTDDQGYGDLACHGNDIIQTPALDKLYGESARLTNFHVGTTCAPTRASLLTGRYCNRTGVWHTVMGRSQLRSDEKTMADIFKENGYNTAMFGKWHLGDNTPFRPNERGFDHAVYHGGGGVGQMPDYWDNDYFDDTYFVNGEPKKFEGYCTDVWFNEAENFIRQNMKRPFFVYLSTNAPHGPFHVPQKYSDMYPNVKKPRQQFYGMISNLDENIARLRKTLETLGLAENTIFIYMTDNGTSAGAKPGKDQFIVDGFNAGMRGTKGSEYDGGHRVPCFIHFPNAGLVEGRDISELSAHLDILPTLADYCSLRSKQPIALDGTTLRPLLDNAGIEWPDRMLVTDTQRIEKPVKWRKSSVMTTNYRLVNGKELYHIKKDPEQKYDISANYPQIAQRLRNFYEEWWADVSKRFGEYTKTVLGADDKEVVLTAHDWHEVERPREEPVFGKEFNPPWNQTHIREGDQANGMWVVDIVKSGTYQIELRRWPKESGYSFNETVPEKPAVPGGQTLPAGKIVRFIKARVKIGDVEKSTMVKVDQQAAVFTVELKKETAILKTWLTNPKLGDFGAYYVYVKRV